jgi:hypothetical protein
VLLATVGRTFEWGRLSAFGYGLEIDGAADVSSDTLGVKLAGARPLGPITATYAVSYARQKDGGANPLDFDADYRLVEAGVRVKKVSVAAGRETLGPGGGAAFSTPLATLHAFQGWADKFLATPVAGVDDDYLRVGYPLGQKGPLNGLTAVATYHDFDADAGGAAYGDEIDLSLVAQLGRMTFTVKYASYAAEGFLSDTDKAWLSMDYAF